MTNLLLYCVLLLTLAIVVQSAAMSELKSLDSRSRRSAVDGTVTQRFPDTLEVKPLEVMSDEPLTADRVPKRPDIMASRRNRLNRRHNRIHRRLNNRRF